MKYIVKLSNKAEIQIDEDEVARVVDGLKSGTLVKVRQGIFNPSFFVAVVEDENRKPIDHYSEGLIERKNLPDIFTDLKQLS